MRAIEVSREIAGRPLRLVTGKVARQAHGAVLAQYGDTVVLATAVWKRASTPMGFLPLLVEYREQTFAAGKIPGGFLKREGRPKDREILIGRAIDRALRPLFPEGMMDEVEIVVQLLSYDLENEPHFLGILAASSALMVSEIPFGGPVAAVRLGYAEGPLLNPTNSDIASSMFDLLVAGRDPGTVSMIEFTGNEVAEDRLLEMLEFAQEPLETLRDMQEELAQKVGVTKAEPTRIEIPSELYQAVKMRAEEQIRGLFGIPGKVERETALFSLEDAVVQDLLETFPEEVAIRAALYKLEKEIFREKVFAGERMDGRDPEAIRPIDIEVGVLPRTHGSALFTRGETQALVVTTLGTAEDVQRMGELDPEEFKRFMLHYNFPPFSTREVKPLRGPSRREIGHGALAEKSVAPLVPSEEAFPYTIRVVSQILESNGSSSMATVCGASLSLMDAGVPIRTAVAGISIGLVADETRHILLTDILGAEDHYGEMDFKVAGTRTGITGIQLDLKRSGLPLTWVKEALERAREARHHILDIMDRVLPEPRAEVSRHAPKVVAITIPREKIGEVIGPGGRTIRKILEETGTKIDIEDSTGRVTIAGPTYESVEEARRRIEEITTEVEVGSTFLGKVVRIEPYGAFVEIKPGKVGLLHISELAPHRVKKVEDVLKLGDEVLVKVIDVDPQGGKFKLSRKAVLRSGVKIRRPKSASS